MQHFLNILPKIKHGMANRLKKRFLKDWTLMRNILQAISILSDALESREKSILTANKLIKITILAF
jgi:hypothetical protein